MTRIALLGGIEGNLSALDATLSLLRREQVTDLVVLGNVVGPFARTLPCLELLWRGLEGFVTRAVTKGNLERFVLGEFSDDRLSASAARMAVARDRAALAHAPDLLAFVRSWPRDSRIGEIVACNTTALDSVSLHRDLSPDTALRLYDDLGAARVVVSPSSEPPVLIEETTVRAEPLAEGPLSLPENTRAIVGIGSVGTNRGQRLKEARARFAVFDEQTRTLHLRSVAYDPSEELRLLEGVLERRKVELLIGLVTPSRDV